MRCYLEKITYVSGQKRVDSVLATRLVERLKLEVTARGNLTRLNTEKSGEDAS